MTFPAGILGSPTGLASSAMARSRAAGAAAIRIDAGKHIPALDAVRGIAVLLVMGFHFTMLSANGSALSNRISQVAVLGRCGVDLFFVLSGFLITGILYDAKGGQSYFRNFYARRMLRIFPLYYGALALFVIVIPFVLHLPTTVYRAGVQHQGWLWVHAANIGLLARGDGYFGELGHLWSLAVEEHFYLIWPLIVFAFARKTLIRLCIGLVFASLALRVVLMSMGDNQTVCYLFTACRFDQLATGGLVALVARGPLGLGPLLRPAKWVLPICFAALLLILGVRDRFHAPEHDDVLMPTIGYTVLAFGFAAGIVLAVGAPVQSVLGLSVNHRLLRMFGKYSYALYIFHPVIFESVLRVGHVNGGPGSSKGFVLGYLALGPVCLMLSLCCAWVSWHGFEKHFLKLKRYFVYPASPVTAADLAGEREAAAASARRARMGIGFFLVGLGIFLGFVGGVVLWSDPTAAAVPALLFWVGTGAMFFQIGRVFLRENLPGRALARGIGSEGTAESGFESEPMSTGAG